MATVMTHKNDARQNAEFVSLLTSHQRRLYLYIITFLPNPADVDDVLQRVNMVLWSKVDEYAPGTNFGAWAYRVAFYEVLAFRKRVQSERLLFSSDLMHTMAEEHAAEDEWKETRCRALRTCLGKLRPADRDLLARRYGADSTVGQVAEELARPLKSIYRSLERVRMSLLECIRRTMAVEGVDG